MRAYSHGAIATRLHRKAFDVLADGVLTKLSDEGHASRSHITVESLVES